jgi:ribose transport system ATP-binding protein
VSDKVLEIRGLNKYFGPTHANRDIDFELGRGEIRGLIGENGSGKSTLISQIAGLYHRDSGVMTLNGEEYSPRNPIEANTRKISMVMQELGVVGTLPVGLNVFLGHTNKFTTAGVVNLNALNKAANAVFEKWELPRVPLNNLMGDMMVETRKIVELARALSIEPDVLLLDEITQSLSMNNREMLYKLLRKFKEIGKSVIVITHDVDELIGITDTITVLRDGAVVGNVISAETTADEVKIMMVGREIEGDYYRSDNAPDYSDSVALRVENLTVDGEIEDISFDVHNGEILAFCGLSDSGIHSVGKAVYGLSKRVKGTSRLDNKDIKNAMTALKMNVAYVPKDRDHEALMIHTSVLDNFILPSTDTLGVALGFLSPGKLRKVATGMVEKLSVKCTDVFQVIDSLSGGNKQKVNLGRWLVKNPTLLILDCPTRGVDVGVKAYIYSLMKEAKQNGVATILISDELTEALGMADRLIVMKDGKINKEIIRGEDFTEQSVIGDMI